MKGQKFTWRTLEKRSASDIGRFSNVVYPITHGSFPDGKMAVEALASWMQHSGFRVCDIGHHHVVKPNPAVFGKDGIPFPLPVAEDVEELVDVFGNMVLPVNNSLFSLQSSDRTPGRPPVQLSPAPTPTAKTFQDRVSLVRKGRNANGQFASSNLSDIPSL